MATPHATFREWGIGLILVAGVWVGGCNKCKPSFDELEIDATWPTDTIGDTCNTKETDPQCPIGTLCKNDEGSNDTDTKGHCGVPNAVIGKLNVLVDGFNVADFDLKSETETNEKIFFFVPPVKAKQVRCAVFVNQPVVEANGKSSQCHGRNLGRIVNAKTSIVWTRTFNLSSQEKDATNGYRFSLDTFQEYGLQKTIVTVLRLGCWANDSEQIVGATQLMDIQPTDLPDVDVPVKSCDDRPELTNGRRCVERSWGICKEGKCALADADSSNDTASEQPVQESVSQTASETPDAGEISKKTTVSEQNKTDHDCIALVDGGEFPTNNGEDCIYGIDIGTCIDGICCMGGACRPDESFNGQIGIIQDCGCILVGEEAGEENGEEAVEEKSGNVKTKGMACPDYRYGGYGTCVDKVCRRRCLNNGDCSDGTDTDESLCSTDELDIDEIDYPLVGGKFINHRYCVGSPSTASCSLSDTDQ